MKDMIPDFAGRMPPELRAFWELVQQTGFTEAKSIAGISHPKELIGKPVGYWKGKLGEDQELPKTESADVSATVVVTRDEVALDRQKRELEKRFQKADKKNEDDIPF